MIEQFKNELQNIVENILFSNPEQQEIYGKFFRLEQEDQYYKIEFLKEIPESLYGISNQANQRLTILVPIAEEQDPYLFLQTERFGITFEELFERNPQYFSQLLAFLDEINTEIAIEMSFVEEKSKNSSDEKFTFLNSLTNKILTNLQSQNQRGLNQNINDLLSLKKADCEIVINEIIAQLLENPQSKENLQNLLQSLLENPPKFDLTLEIYQNSISYLENLIAHYDKFDRFFAEIDGFFEAKEEEFERLYQSGNFQEIKESINHFIDNLFSRNEDLIKEFYKKSLNKFLKKEAKDEELQQISSATKSFFINYLARIISGESEIDDSVSSLLKEIMINNHFALLQEKPPQTFLYEESPEINAKANLFEQVSLLESQLGLRRRELPQIPEKSIRATSQPRRMLPARPNEHE